MSIVKAQFADLKEEFPNATLKALVDGSFLITLPDLSLLEQWSDSKVTVMFLAPVGYPHAKPDCFWVQPRLSVNGNLPQAVQDRPIPEAEAEGNYMWFSWHIAQWNPNRDNLITFTRVIKNRFEESK